MTWLDDAARQSGFSSLAKLAQQLVEPGPEGSNPSDASESHLANMLRAANKGNVTWWFHKGAPYLHPLADLLVGWSPRDLRDKLAAEAEGVGATLPIWRFSDVAGLAPLDLRTEVLPPGFPDAFRLRTSSSPWLWWMVQEGSGQLLARRWFEVRHNAQLVEATDWAEARPQLPTAGLVYVVLQSPRAVRPSELKLLPDGLQVIIEATIPLIANARQPQSGAAHVAGSEQDRKEGDQESTKGEQHEDDAPAAQAESPLPGWRQVASPPPRLWLPDFVDWLAERLPAGGGLEIGKARQLATTTLTHWIHGIDDALQLFGLWDEVGTTALFGDGETQEEDPERAMRAWVRARLAGSGDRSQAQRLSEALISMEEARLRGEQPVDLPAETWAALIPTKLSGDIATSTLLDKLGMGGHEEAEARAAMSRPSALELVSTLAGLGLLRHTRSQGALCIAPALVASLAATAAARRMRNDLPMGLGTLLLSPRHSQAALEYLYERAATRPGWILDALDAVDEADHPSPEAAVTIEALFRATGITALTGSDVPPASLEALWAAQMPLVARRWRNAPPTPIIAPAAAAHAGPNPGPTKSLPHDMTVGGHWVVAALSISRVLQAARFPLPVSALAPWAGNEVDGKSYSETAWVVRNLAQAHRNAAPEQAQAIRVLAGEMLDLVGFQGLPGGSRELLGPWLLVRWHLGALPNLDRTHWLTSLPGGLEAVKAECTRQSVPFDDLVEWLWHKWARMGLPTCLALDEESSSADALELWARLPADVIDQTDGGMLSTLPPQGLQRLTPNVFEAWLRWYAVDSHLPDTSGTAVWQAMPRALARKALFGGLLRPHAGAARRVLWERIPREVLDIVDELAANAPVAYPEHPKALFHPLAEQLFAADDRHIEHLVERAAEWLSEPSRWPGANRRQLLSWLRHLVAERRAGWRSAWRELLKHHNAVG